jgi:hypothetical protein
MDKKGYGSKEEIEKVAEDVWDQLKSFGSGLLENKFL